MESESKNIIQMLKNVKQIIDISKERNCWKDEELKEVGTTYHNVCEILRQLQEKQTQAKQTQAKQTQAKQTQAKQTQEKDQRFEEITDDPVLEEPEPESEEPMEEVN